MMRGRVGTVGGGGSGGRGGGGSASEERRRRRRELFAERRGNRGRWRGDGAIVLVISSSSVFAPAEPAAAAAATAPQPLGQRVIARHVRQPARRQADPAWDPGAQPRAAARGPRRAGLPGGGDPGEPEHAAVERRLDAAVGRDRAELVPGGSLALAGRGIEVGLGCFSFFLVLCGLSFSFLD